MDITTTFFHARGAWSEPGALEADLRSALRSALRSGARSALGARGGAGARARTSSWRTIEDGGRVGYSGGTVVSKS